MSQPSQRPFTPAAFNLYIGEKKLMGSRCPTCEETFIPPRAICPLCHSEDMAWVEAGTRGKLAAFTSIFIGPTAMNNAGFGRDNPYVTGIVELEEGPMISARIIGVDARHPENIRIDTPVEAAFVEEGGKTILAFKPVEA